MSDKAWFKVPSEALYKPCRCCGGREVVKTTTASSVAGKAWVVVECRFCEARRGGYHRKAKP